MPFDRNYITKMPTADRMRLRELLMIFVVGMSQYPTDADRAEEGMRIIEQFIDQYNDAQLVKSLAPQIKMRVN